MFAVKIIAETFRVFYQLRQPIGLSVFSRVIDSDKINDCKIALLTASQLDAWHQKNSVEDKLAGKLTSCFVEKGP